MTPLVSILMPAWQCEKFVFDAIESIQTQTCPNWELIVCEDGSADETLDEILRAAHDDARIHVVIGEHAGQAESLNRAADVARGTFLARLDADDMHHPLRISQQIGMLDEDPNITHVTCDMMYIDEQGAFIKNVIVGPMDIQRYLNGETGVCNGSAVWRRAFHVDNKLRWRAEHDVSCDTDYNLQGIAAGAQWGFLAKPWYYQRRHPGQMTKRLGGEMSAKFAELLGRYTRGEYGH